jgi:hypothetical protein
MAKIGLNVDGEGNAIGLWIDADSVVTDGHAYVNLSAEEMEELARELNNVNMARVSGGWDV